MTKLKDILYCGSPEPLFFTKISINNGRMEIPGYRFIAGEYDKDVIII